MIIIIILDNLTIFPVKNSRSKTQVIYLPRVSAPSPSWAFPCRTVWPRCGRPSPRWALPNQAAHYRADRRRAEATRPLCWRAPLSAPRHGTSTAHSGRAGSFPPSWPRPTEQSGSPDYRPTQWHQTLEEAGKILMGHRNQFLWAYNTFYLMGINHASPYFDHLKPNFYHLSPNFIICPLI